jgi:type I restriction-modification system DNA methylase subunit
MPSSIYKEYTGQIKDIIEKVTPFALKLKESITILLNDKNLNELTKKKTQDLEKYLNIILKKIKTSIGMVLNNDDFNSLIDIYVQSLIFGLFISYILYQNNDYYQNFKRNQKFNIPLINIFHIIFEEFEIKIRPSNLGPLIQSIEKILMDNSLLLNKSMQHFFHNFYSDFLRSYNPKTKKDLGVIYTPDSIVQFIIESVDYFLIQKFSLPSGVVDKQVLFYRPCCWYNDISILSLFLYV